THQLAEHRFAHSGLARRGGVAGDAIGAAIGDAHGEINHLLRQRIERARRHDLLHARPGAREQRRIMRQIFFQKLLTSSTCRVRLMSSNTVRTFALALRYSMAVRGIVLSPWRNRRRFVADCRKRGQRAQSLAPKRKRTKGSVPRRVPCRRRRIILPERRSSSPGPRAASAAPPR